MSANPFATIENHPAAQHAATEQPGTDQRQPRPLDDDALTSSGVEFSYLIAGIQTNSEAKVARSRLLARNDCPNQMLCPVDETLVSSALFLRAISSPITVLDSLAAVSLVERGEAYFHFSRDVCAKDLPNPDASHVSGPPSEGRRPKKKFSIRDQTLLADLWREASVMLDTTPVGHCLHSQGRMHVC